ncbi:2-C-methyl-D-erythritol 4-phosphate cytidylyltransferase [Kutzneria viridogrisea]|uniref:2-C-methyl-D-erythritol 4-phosphate cytidylyltransferase n=2 Tax=Kutzneria TaxID=43356 RepID=W5W6J1_9PSEU|nr:2-C-methyl-D-erythritol 4-phosphate cytidylyltransferase [Kutzneria albida]AHH93804.1 2-C-methyl-D-erythritol 4-phosphate cytidylyltransferase [Kutzneria albida DSM 43870]MBA8931191.1 2-C-methyl-D-erythritol 4-phosphate cytidylyltransferase [Kutzneria viridogrisea]
MSVVALVPAAGRGERLGAELPKALVPVCGAPLLVHAVRGLLAAGCVQHVVVAAPAAHLDVVTEALAVFAPAVHVVPGGGERSDSVRLALDEAMTRVPDASVVLVHDAARAFTPPEVVRAVVDAVRAGSAAVIPVLPVADTVKQVDADGLVVATPDRSALRVVQTPQGFEPALLRRAHEGATGATDDAGLVERLGEPVHTVPGHPHAMKITTPFDLVLAEALFTKEAHE